jgi:hypothetical protein
MCNVAQTTKGGWYNCITMGFCLKRVKSYGCNAVGALFRDKTKGEGINSWLTEVLFID